VLRAKSAIGATARLWVQKWQAFVLQAPCWQPQLPIPRPRQDIWAPSACFPLGDVPLAELKRRLFLSIPTAVQAHPYIVRGEMTLAEQTAALICKASRGADSSANEKWSPHPLIDCGPIAAFPLITQARCKNGPSPLSAGMTTPRSNLSRIF
jgi:hypothetical protein